LAPVRHFPRLSEIVSFRDDSDLLLAPYGKSKPQNSFFALGLLWSLAGCASVGVRNPQQATSNPKLPKQILIADFDTSQNVFHISQTGTELGVLQQKTSNVLANYLVSDLSKSVMPAARQGGSRPARANAWLITGEFVRVNGDSRELRGLVGLGLGGTKMETVGRVHDLSRLSKEPVLQFETSGGSNAEPGALVGGMFEALPNAYEMLEPGASCLISSLTGFWRPGRFPHYYFWSIA
jgi:hypothetical protein